MLSFLKQLFPQLVRWTITKTTQLGNVHQTKHHFQVLLSSFCILALFIFLLLLFVEPLRNEATVERGIKDVTHTKKRTRNILHFPFCILCFWLRAFLVVLSYYRLFSYNRLLQYFSAIWRSSAFTPWFQLLYPPPPSLQKESQCFLH